MKEDDETKSGTEGTTGNDQEIKGPGDPVEEAKKAGSTVIRPLLADEVEQVVSKPSETQEHWEEKMGARIQKLFGVVEEALKQRTFHTLRMLERPIVMNRPDEKPENEKILRMYLNKALIISFIILRGDLYFVEAESEEEMTKKLVELKVDGFS